MNPHVGFAVDSVALGQVSPPPPQSHFVPCQYHSTSAPDSLVKYFICVFICSLFYNVSSASKTIVASKETTIRER
jgi:hypothetical protein